MAGWDAGDGAGGGDFGGFDDEFGAESEGAYDPGAGVSSAERGRGLGVSSFSADAEGSGLAAAAGGDAGRHAVMSTEAAGSTARARADATARARDAGSGVGGGAGGGGGPPSTSGDGLARNDAPGRERAPSSSSRPSHRFPAAGSGQDPFLSGAWLAMCRVFDLPLPSHAGDAAAAMAPFFQYTIASIPRDRSCCKVPQMALLVHALTRGDEDATVKFQDPSGFIDGSLHGGVLDEFAPDVAVGAVLIVRNVTVYRPPTGAAFYLNVVPDNVIRVFAPVSSTTIAPAAATMPEHDRSGGAPADGASPPRPLAPAVPSPTAAPRGQERAREGGRERAPARPAATAAAVARGPDIGDTSDDELDEAW
mmetsp:Transcript_11559/g.40432  ORF Transcript_11559/g.40432 Transcript_11559/m.40432 type:complete len:365 (-) Transcript_11559:52-1146(-)